MSGGVDSSVAAALLLEEGHDVTGVTMQLWPEGDAEGGCCSVSASRDARRVCDLLGIPHYVLQFRDVFEHAVVEPFRRAYAEGRTPNPCIVCNDVVKFEELLRRAQVQGAEFLATGHYARIVADERGGRWLRRAADENKDQSYFLYRMTPEQLGHVLFPVGELTKPQVRAKAIELGLPTARKTESQEVCFVPRDDYRAFLAASHRAAVQPGPIVDLEGRVLGRHEGVSGFTVGQRKGLGLAGGPWFVVRTDAETATVVVGPKEALAVRRVLARDLRWRGGGHEHVGAQLRYRGRALPAEATLADDALTVTLVEPEFGVAPGQAIVCYRGDIVIGGGTVEETA